MATEAARAYVEGMVFLLAVIAASAGGDPGPAGEAPAGSPAPSPVAVGLSGAGRSSRMAIEQTVEEIAPLVAQIAGRRFTQVPGVLIADIPRIEQVLYEEQVHLLRNATDLGTEAARREARAAVANTGGLFVGKYGFLDHNLYIVPGAVRAALAEEGLDPTLESAVLELVIAHELTHALQDQQADLDESVIHQSGKDAVMALNCLIEGHAVWVHEQVGRARGHPEAVDAVARILGYDLGSPHGVDPGRYYTSYVYGQGRTFVEHHLTRGGPEAVWTLFVHPPLSSSMIVDPATYGNAPATLPEETRRALRRGRDRFVGDEWTLGEEVVGDFDLRERLMEARASTHLADRLVGAWATRGAPKAGAAGAEVQLLRFDAADAAWSYVQAMHANAGTLLADAMSETNGAIEGTVGLWDGVPSSDLAAREVIGLTSMNGQQLSTHWVARGPYVVQVVLVNAPPSERTVAAQINRVLRTVE